MSIFIAYDDLQAIPSGLPRPIIRRMMHDRLPFKEDFPLPLKAILIRRFTAAMYDRVQYIAHRQRIRTQLDFYRKFKCPALPRRLGALRQPTGLSFTPRPFESHLFFAK